MLEVVWVQKYLCTQKMRANEQNWKRDRDCVWRLFIESSGRDKRCHIFAQIHFGNVWIYVIPKTRKHIFMCVILFPPLLSSIPSLLLKMVQNELISFVSSQWKELLHLELCIDRISWMCCPSFPFRSKGKSDIQPWKQSFRCCQMLCTRPTV